MNFPNTIDRHLGREWLKSFSLTTGAILGLFYIQNLYDKLGDFINHGAGVTQIAHYYILLTPSLLSPVLPLSVLVATLLSFGTLHRNQEIAAMRSMGCSIWSLIRLNLFFCILLSVGLFFQGNGALSQSIEKSRELHESLTQKQQDPSAKNNFFVRHLTFENTSAQRLWVMNRYNPMTQMGYGVYLYFRDEQGHCRERFTARTAEFIPESGTWVFREGRYVVFDEAGFPLRFEDFPEKEMRDIDPPRTLLARQKKMENLSFLELQELVMVNRAGEDKEARRYMVRYHQAISGPFNCVLALLLGVPFAIAGTRVNAMVASTKAIGIFVGYFFLVGIFRMFGEQGFLSPVFAGWLPMGLMTFYALILIIRLR
ncbi:MAG: YjgP/YjgQ family permease [Opitutae bacterium]|nr:YjgP/YjgQ family permease [Opitutae bacterium]MBT5377720.1 YjgP/YjgQ family permease [Opitutae bacterium]MBT5692930.1 YjgP/YjgQ family permease [Opitutae bacterium]MBT6460958.1 YjgP/YjgQ family permease [Opitutae bacterium]MBT7852224.1 YjgP/YjgQ family permease [Opitutae bacterium]